MLFLFEPLRTDLNYFQEGDVDLYSEENKKKREELRAHKGVVKEIELVISDQEPFWTHWGVNGFTKSLL